MVMRKPLQRWHPLHRRRNYKSKTKVSDCTRCRRFRKPGKYSTLRPHGQCIMIAPPHMRVAHACNSLIAFDKNRILCNAIYYCALHNTGGVPTIYGGRTMAQTLHLDIPTPSELT